MPRQYAYDPTDGTRSPAHFSFRNRPTVCNRNLSIDDIREVSTRKLMSPQASLLKALLIQNALDILDRSAVIGFDAEVSAAPASHCDVDDLEPDFGPSAASPQNDFEEAWSSMCSLGSDDEMDILHDTDSSSSESSANSEDGERTDVTEYMADLEHIVAQEQPAKPLYSYFAESERPMSPSKRRHEEDDCFNSKRRESGCVQHTSLSLLSVITCL